MRSLGQRGRRITTTGVVLGLAFAVATGAVGASKLPRFASLRAAEVNVRTGPGVRYPVEWVFVYRHMPVEIVAEYDTWRKVRDWEGTVGWIHQSMLSGRRTVIVRGDSHPARRQPDQTAEVVARVEERVSGRLLECSINWCRVDIAGIRGWMRRSHLWGIYRGEEVR
jgi:SH3-like domain-containing protein